jgi:hypothetical protein
MAFYTESGITDFLTERYVGHIWIMANVITTGFAVTHQKEFYTRHPAFLYSI